MEIYKIAAIGIISVILIVYLKSINAELAVIVGVASGILILLLSVTYIKEFISFFEEVARIGGIDNSIFKLVLKIIAISYLIEFSGSIATDFGQTSLANKIQFAGKLIMVTLAIPLIKNMIDFVVSLI